LLTDLTERKWFLAALKIMATFKATERSVLSRLVVLGYIGRH
jgi:hypothetical protein